jgi:hypothetical protein
VALELEPRFEQYVGHALAPLGLYIDSWSADWVAGELVEVDVLLMNDLQDDQAGSLVPMAVDAEGVVRVRIGGCRHRCLRHGEASQGMQLVAPDEKRWFLVARLSPEDPAQPEVWSRRKFGVEHPGVLTSEPPYESR